MSEELTANQRRAEAAVVAYELVASDLLRDQYPREEAVGLLALVVSDSIVAGDREALGVTLLSLKRLRGYCPDQADAAWSGELGAALRILSMICRWSLILLDGEYAEAR